MAIYRELVPIVSERAADQERRQDRRKPISQCQASQGVCEKGYCSGTEHLNIEM